MRAVKILLPLLFFSVASLLFFPRKKDKEDYLSLLSLSEKKAKRLSAVNETKDHVVKEMWYDDKYLLIEAPKADLFWKEKEGTIEECYDVRVSASEVNEGKNILRLLSCAKGSFSYQDLSFSGQEVHFSSTTLSSGQKPELTTPDLQGQADKLSFQLSEKKMNALDSLECDGNVHFKLKGKGEIVCDRFNGNSSEKSLIFQGEKGIFYSDCENNMVAQKGMIYFMSADEWRADKVVLEGPVLLSKESATALADRVEYWPLTQQLHLFSEKSPVLFFDKEKGMTLSAKEIVASKEKVYGVGNVHFTLSEEELEKLKKQFVWKEKAS